MFWRVISALAFYLLVAAVYLMAAAAGDALPFHPLGLLPEHALVLAVGVGILPPLGAVAWFGARLHPLWQQAREARRRHHAADRLTSGPAVVAGTVAFAEGADHAVQVGIQQRGQTRDALPYFQRSDLRGDVYNALNGPTGGLEREEHSWTEMGRIQRASPFFLVRPDGTRILVEPAKRYRLYDDLDLVVQNQAGVRTRFANLAPGETVYVTGHLERRDDEGWALVAPPGGLMELSAGEPHRAQESASRQAGILVLEALTLFLFAQLVLAPYWGLMLEGEALTGRVERVEIGPFERDGVDRGGTPTLMSEAIGTAPGLGRFAVGVSFGRDYETEERGTIPLLWSPTTRHLIAGEAPTFGMVRLLFLLLLVGGGLPLLLRRQRTQQPWWTAPVQDQGSGRLHPATGLLDPHSGRPEPDDEP